MYMLHGCAHTCVRLHTHCHTHVNTHTNCLQYTIKVIKLTEENKIKGEIITHWLYNRLVTEIHENENEKSYGNLILSECAKD